MGFKEDFKSAVIDAIGVGTGYVASDFTGELVAKHLKMAGKEKTAVKIVMRIIFGILGVFGGSATTGVVSVFLLMFGVGALAGIMVDLIGLAIPGGIGALTTAMVNEMNEEEIVVQAKDADDIENLAEAYPIVRW